MTGMATTTDFYQLLGVSRGATDEQIRSAYRKLARQLHPDVNKEPDAAQRFKEITEAYEILTDPQRRQRYDMFGSTTAGGFGDFGIGDLFETFFGGDLRRREPRGPMRGADLRMEIEIDLLDAVQGRERVITVPRLETCERCHGNGAEPGTSTSTCATCNGRGEARMRGGPTGDLYVLIRLKEHALFRREGDDLVHLARLSPAQAALGDEIGVPTIEGPEAKVRVPAGAQHGQMVRVRGKGVPHL